MPSIPLLRLEAVVTPERLEDIKQLAEVRLRVGDVMAAFTLELVDEIKEAKAAGIRVQSRLDDALALLSAKSAQLEAVLAKRLDLSGALEAADQKIDELQERSAWFEAERRKDQLRLKSAEDEIIRLRRHLGEIP